MTKTKIDYSKGLIYKIVCKDLECKDIYVGSTTDFIRRKYKHKSVCTNENSRGYNYKIYQTIRANGGWGNWSMIEIEKYPCEDGNELRARERAKYEELKGTLNSCIPNRSIKEQKKEYYEHNKKKINEQHKKYYETNKEKINEKNKEYREQHKEQLKEKRKEFYKNNKEILKEKIKEYYKNNKEKIKEREKQKINCMCGSTILKHTKLRHERSQKHLNYLNSQLD